MPQDNFKNINLPNSKAFLRSISRDRSIVQLLWEERNERRKEESRLVWVSAVRQTDKTPCVWKSLEGDGGRRGAVPQYYKQEMEFTHTDAAAECVCMNWWWADKRTRCLIDKWAREKGREHSTPPKERKRADENALTKLIEINSVRKPP